MCYSIHSSTKHRSMGEHNPHRDCSLEKGLYSLRPIALNAPRPRRRDAGDVHLIKGLFRRLGCGRGETPGRVMHEDEITHPWKDLLAPAPSIENAVMPNPFLKVIRPLLRWDVSAQPVGCTRLAGCRDVVHLALDREQRRMSDGGGIDCLTLPGHGSTGKRVPLENP